MRRLFLTTVCLLSLWQLISCSPRDFLTRRLATDLISGSAVFRSQQQFVLRTGLLSNKDYVSPEYLVFQRRGWISAASAPCPVPSSPAPCWDVILTPSGVDAIRSFVAPEERSRASFNVPVARRELVSVTGIAKQGNMADVEFVWRWIPLNEFGGAIYSSDMHYKSVVGFRYYDDGWRLMQSAPLSGQSLDDALKNSEVTQ